MSWRRINKFGLTSYEFEFRFRIFGKVFESLECETVLVCWESCMIDVLLTIDV